MQVQNINSNNYRNSYSPNFGLMNVTEKGQKLLNKWWGQAPEKMDKINGWKKDLLKTDNFDLNFEELCKDMFLIIESKNPDWPSCEAPLRVYNFPKGRRLDVFGTDLIDCGDFVSYPLEFGTNQDAVEAYNTLKSYQKEGAIYTIDKVKWAVDSVKILEKAFKYMENPKVEKNVAETSKAAEIATPIETKADKVPFLERLKNAWLALKG